MKIELGKYYRTQDGNKVGPAQCNGYPGCTYPYNIPHECGFHGYTKEGKSCLDTPEDDIVSEWFDVGDKVYNEFYGGQYGTVVGFEDDYILVQYDEEFCSIWKGHKWLTRPEEITKVAKEEVMKTLWVERYKDGDGYTVGKYYKLTEDSFGNSGYSLVDDDGDYRAFFADEFYKPVESENYPEETKEMTLKVGDKVKILESDYSAVNLQVGCVETISEVWGGGFVGIQSKYEDGSDGAVLSFNKNQIEKVEEVFKVGDKVGSTYSWDSEYQYGVVNKVDGDWITTDWLDKDGTWVKSVGYYQDKLYKKPEEESIKKPMHPDDATQAIKDFLEDNGFAFCTLSFETQDGAYYHAD